MLFDGGPYVTGSPRWSPDGRRIVFDTRAKDPAHIGNPSIWTVNADGGDAKALTAAATGVTVGYGPATRSAGILTLEEPAKF